MSCDRTDNLLHAYLDDELTLSEQLSFEEHLAGCADCQRAQRTYTKLREDLQQSDLRFELPAHIRRQVQAVAKPARFTLGRALAMAAAIAILILGASLVFLRTDQDKPMNELVDAHVRSLQADHLMDVVSTDQHTVKPWFDGKLEFAPPVIDLSSKGFELTGGRLDYLQDHQAAALIYRRNKHYINLFIWPGSASPQVKAIRGFNLVRFECRGMVCWAVSDLNAGELQQFADLFSAQSSPSTRS